MSPMNSALIRYWHRLPAESPAARRKSLDAIRERLHAGLEPRSALVPFALCDVDEAVVVAATQAYVTRGDGSLDVTCLDEATEWVRRGLALNRGAVFGALLALEEAGVFERLAALRLLLSAAEVEVTCRALGSAPGPRALAFLHDWAELAADDLPQRGGLLACTAAHAADQARAA